METIESAFDRSRPATSVLRWVACIAAAVSLVLLGFVLAPRNASPSRAAGHSAGAPQHKSQAPPVPLDEPTPLDGPGFLGEQASPPPASDGPWCADSRDDLPNPPEASWPTARLDSYNATYTLNHPSDWQVQRGEGFVLISSPDSAMFVTVVYGQAGLTSSEFIASGREALAELFGVDVQRSERATVAGAEGCRALGTAVEDGIEMEAEFLWGVVGEDNVVAFLYADSGLPSSEKEIGSRVLNSLAAEAPNASAA